MQFFSFIDGLLYVNFPYAQSLEKDLLFGRFISLGLINSLLDKCITLLIALFSFHTQSNAAWILTTN
jgi:hypothetical protein